MVAVERIEPDTESWQKYYPNHIMRYDFAKNIINKDKVHFILDAACGVGYGTNYLSSFINGRIIGVDINNDALKIANDKFSSDGIEFIEDDCEQLYKLNEQESFSAIISFETFEHLRQPEKFLEKAYYLLQKGGVLIVSTPNKFVSSPNGKVNWEFHETEYTPGHFFQYFKKFNFKNISLYGQQLTSIGSFRKKHRHEMKELYKIISFNPFYRLGNLFKKVAGKKIPDIGFLEQEYLEDFEIVLFENVEKMEILKANGPFVQIVVATK